MAEKHHITEICETRALLEANLDAKQSAIESDQEEYFAYKTTGGTYCKNANIDQAANFLDTTITGDLTVQSGNIYIGNGFYLGIDNSNPRILFDDTNDELEMHDADIIIDDGKYIGNGDSSSRILFDATDSEIQILGGDIIIETGKYIGISNTEPRILFDGTDDEIEIHNADIILDPDKYIGNSDTIKITFGLDVDINHLDGGGINLNATQIYLNADNVWVDMGTTLGIDGGTRLFFSDTDAEIEITGNANLWIDGDQYIGVKGGPRFWLLTSTDPDKADLRGGFLEINKDGGDYAGRQLRLTYYYDEGVDEQYADFEIDASGDLTITAIADACPNPGNIILDAASLNLSTNSVPFHPHRTASDDPPTLATGELRMWCDTNDSNKVYLIYKDVTGGQKMVQLPA